MILDRLRVRGKLNLLLLLPLVAVVLVTVPFVAGQVNSAGSATATADSARDARLLGALVWELQRERLITADYLADPTANDSDMLVQQQVVADSADDLRRSLGSGASDELTSAVVRLGSLVELRANARLRGVAEDSVARAYHAVIEALIDALRLVPQRTTDAEGTRQLTALDALLRANEESAMRGMALIAAAISPQSGLELLTTSQAQSQLFTERFVQQADADQAALVVLVDQGEAAHRVDALVGALPNASSPAAVQAFVANARAAVEAQAGLRRLVQDQVTSQIAGAAGGRASSARTAAWSVGLGATILFALVIFLAIVVSRSIARPLQRLTRAATAVANLANAELVRVTDVEQVDEQPPRLAAIDVSSGDEVGELAVAFNRVQTTAAMLLERQVVTRRNVSLMFANVAQRTQNLVRRQLALVDDLERDEQNTRLLSRLYRLDHLSTRLRRSAENLLVVAGSRDETRISAPTPMTTVLRSALAEIEDYQRVNFGGVHEVTVAAALVSDLVLIFAELLENATAFSPPESTVHVLAMPAADGWCRVSIVDHGIGMSAHRLAEENHRLVERERLDIVPTSVLGLFVVGRLARRHGLAIELTATPGGGTTATVAVPPSMHTQGTFGIPQARTPAGMPRRPSLALAGVPPIPTVPGSFSWFALKQEKDDGTEPDGGSTDDGSTDDGSTDDGSPDDGLAAAAIGVDQRPGLNRRVPGAQLPVAAGWTPDPLPTPPAGRQVHDPAAARSTMDAFQSAVTLAGTVAPPAPPVRTPPVRTAPPAPSTWDTPASTWDTPPSTVASPALTGLARRTPGASLAAGLREIPTAATARWTGPVAPRDPEAQRAAFDGYQAGLAEADRQAGHAASQDTFSSSTKEGTS